MSETIKTRVLVVGGGPGGYVTALRAAQLGLQVTLVEGDRLGGTCLIRGCIPSKALIHAAAKFSSVREAAKQGGSLGISLSVEPTLNLSETVRWKDGVVNRLNEGVAGLLRRAKVQVISGWASFNDARSCVVQTASGAVTITAEHVVLATGSEPVALPGLPFGGPIISSTEALSLQSLPRSLAVIGAGYIGLELGSAFRKLGVDVTVLEAQDRILPLYDSALVKPVARWLERAGVAVHLGATVMGFEAGSLFARSQDGKTLAVKAEQVLVTVGRRPRTQGWGLENMGVDMSGRFVYVDDQCRTSMRNVWAIGDLVGEPMLEHKAAAQGEMVAELIAGQRRRFNPVAIPAVCFTEPEIVSVGLSPGDAGAGDIEVINAQFPFAANGRALSMEASDTGGFVRVVARKHDRRLLGIQAVGAHVSELSGEFALALEMGATLEDIAGVIHAHPTLSEAFFETALAGLGHALHV
ncbi:dihydrolipoyl dehydrogenase [Steroidobacter sp. S1-65]|uniref:Dihydrolipoyl dehydrogenase n=1 Tax=Steroidobacter gossypii TaxID=2805490 RepID=A0ABS1WWY8_9GAMM|nr:dihydrolipoyl dehydrogenase [Steroidobacter gossypii]MBM0105477.1 dihydrolipoyl dehydrogenase [Steroidobacter gossypii]